MANQTNSLSLINVRQAKPLVMAIALTALTTTISTAGTAAYAAEAPSNAELYKMLLELQSENARLKKEVEKLSAAPVAPAASPAVTAIAYSADAPKFEFGIDVPYLTLNSNHGSEPGSGSGNGFLEDFDQKAAYRLTAAYQWGNGIGVRGRYFDYDSDTVSGMANSHVETQLYDIELTTSLNLDKWNFVAFGGVRGGKIKWPDEDNSSGYEFEGVGFTVGADVRRTLGMGFSVVAGVRHSQLFGDINEQASPADSNENNVVPITDLHAGIEYDHKFRNGGLLTLGLGYEATLFSSLSGNVDNDIDPEDTDLSLAGPRVSLKYRF